MYLRAILLLTAMLTFLVAPDVAMAQNIFTPVSGDKSMELLASLFGKLGVFGSSGTDAFADVITAFNSAVLTIGGVLVSYTILIGTIGTAHDGEMLGKKFSSAWVPIRTAAGTALVLPVIGGSYCVMQALVGWLIVQGIGLADMVWGTYMSSSNIAKQVSVNASSYSKDYKAAWGMFSSAVCMYGYEKVIQEARANNSFSVSNSLAFGISNSISGGELSPEETMMGAVGSAGGLTYYYGATSPGDGFKEDSCGSVSLSAFAAPSASGPVGNQFGTSLIDRQKINQMSAQAAVAQVAAFEALKNEINQAAKAFVENPSSTSAVNAVKSATAKYSKAATDSASGILSTLANFQELEAASKKDGWILAGAWYMRMSYLMDAANMLMGRSPSASGANMNNSGIEAKYADVFIQKYGLKLTALSGVSNGETGVAGAAVSQSSSATSGAMGLWDFLKSGLNLDKVFKNLFQGITNFVLNDGDHPIMAMKGVGAWLLTIAAATFTSYVSAMAALATATQGGGVAVSVSMLPFTLMFWPTLISVGFMLSYILPMMPFMIWIGVILGWIILCVEAIIAAPMWAVMHLSPHGDDMVGTGAQGYRLVLSLMLRPVLMIFGLIAALTIITVFGKLINQIFASVFLLSQQDSNIVILVAGFIAAPLIYMGLMWTLITKTMSIIHVIPDQLLQWFGGGGPQIGDYGQTFGSQGSQTFAAGAAAASMAGRTLSAGKEMKDLKNQMTQAQKQSESVEGDKMSRITSGWDAKGGVGTSDILKSDLSQSNPEMQFNSENLSQADMSKLKDITDANNILGGAEAPLAESFRSDMGQQMANGATFSQAYSGALQNSLGEKYGSGAASYVANSSSGFSNKGEMRKALANVEYASSKYADLPPAQREDKMNTFFKNVESMGSFESALAVKEGKDSGMVGDGFKDNPTGVEKPPSE